MTDPPVPTMSAAEYQRTGGAAKPAKYGNVKVAADGYTFDSKAEYRRYQELRLLEQAGELTFLLVHPAFDLVVNGVTVGRYVADFEYHLASGRIVVEDVKGVKTEAYRLKKKLMHALYLIDVVEVKA